MNKPKSLQAGTRVDDYEITETLWTTNTGFIYRARDLDRDREVLIQEYLPAIFATRHWSGIHAMALEGFEDEFDQGLTQFLREARILAQLNDPYVCRVYEYTETNATAYMVLDYEPGQTLLEYLSDGEAPLKEGEIRQLLVPLLKGLRVAHAAELLHRDIHPANIYIRDVGPPVLIGFGSPAVALRDDAEHHIEQRVAPGYSPVEQYQSDGDVGPWSDLYALGATMYRCLSGATPIDATRRITHIAQDDEDPLVPAMELGGSDYSAGLLSAIDWMLEPMAADRPESAGSVLGSLTDEVRAAAAPSPESSRSDKARQEKAPRRKEKKEPEAGETPYRDHSQRGAPAPAPSGNKTASPDTKPEPSPAVSVYRKLNTLNIWWGWPLLMVLSGLALIGAFVLYEPAPSPSVAVNNAMPESGFPAPAPDDGYPPPEIPETVKFDHDLDQKRAADYRDLEREITQIEQAVAAAEEKMKQGKLVSPPGDSALADYRSVLALDPDNSDAKLGLAAIKRELVQSAEAAFDKENIDEANRLLDLAQDVRGDNDRITALRQEIEQRLAEKARLQQKALEEERRREQARREAEQARREQIAILLKRAGSAFESGRLAQPPGDNALGHYRSVLRLEPENEAAHAGIDRIGHRYLDQAAQALAQDELDKAEGLLTMVATIMPDNESLPLLRKQLETRRAVAAEQRREQALREQALREQAQREQAQREQAQREQAQREQALREQALREQVQQEQVQQEQVQQEQVQQEQVQREQEAARQAQAGETEQATGQRTAPAQRDADATGGATSGTAADDRELKEGITAYYGGNYEFAFRRLNPLAEQGNTRAKIRVAMMYHHGRGVDQDTNLARTLINEALPALREGAQAGAAWAQSDLGYLYADGIVLAEDDAEAVRLYTLAAEQGYAGAQTNLGVMYANGEGVARDRDKAIAWFRRAAAQGDRIAQNNLQAVLSSEPDSGPASRNQP